MSFYGLGDDSGWPKRCFTYRVPHTEIRWTICVIWLQFPAFLWRGPTPDPALQLPIEIQGVEPAVLNDLEIIDTIHWLSKRMSPDLAKTLDGAVSQGLKSIQARLPAELSLGHS